MKKLLFLLTLVFTINTSAQTTIDWYTPWKYTNAPGYQDLYDGYNAYATKNFAKALKLYLKAAKKGNYWGYCFAGDMLMHGDGVPADTAQAIKLYTDGADIGDANSQYRLAGCYSTGTGVVPNPKTAFIYYKAAADNGYTMAKTGLALCYITGKGTPMNKTEGINLLEKCANEGDVGASFHLGQLYQQNEELKDYSKAIFWYNKSRESSLPHACLQLAIMYAKGQGTEVDYMKAHQLIREARQMAESFHLASEDKKEWLFSVFVVEGYVYLSEKKEDEAQNLWNELKNNYSELVERNRYVETDFLRPMYERDLAKNAQQNKSPQNTSSLIISDIDTKIPENSITGTPTFAVIIANENYKEVEKVPFAVHDGETFKQYCEKTLGIPKNNIKYVADATLNNIRRELNWLGQVMDVYQGEANIIFYYAGHGIPNESNGSAFLLPVDGVGNDVNTGYSLDKLYADLSSKPAKSVMVLLDACFSGARRDGGMLASARGVAIKAKQNAPKGNMVVLSAAQGDETAYPYKEKGHGMFTYYFLKKLQDTKGNVSFGELADYVISEVKKQSIVVNGKMQTPLASPSTNATDWRNWKLR